MKRKAARPEDVFYVVSEKVVKTFFHNKLVLFPNGLFKRRIYRKSILTDTFIFMYNTPKIFKSKLKINGVCIYFLTEAV